MTVEQDNSKNEPKTDWAKVVGHQLSDYMIEGRGDVKGDTVTYKVSQGPKNDPVKVTLDIHKVVELMTDTLGLTPLLPTKFAQQFEYRPEYVPRSRPISEVDKKRRFKAMLRQTISTSASTEDAVFMALSLADRAARKGTIVPMRPEHTLIPETRERPQAAVFYAVDQTISKAYKGTLDSLEKYLNIWFRGSYKDVDIHELRYGDEYAASAENPSVQTIQSPNAVAGLEQVANFAHVAYHPEDWNRYIILITSGQDVPRDELSYMSRMDELTRNMDYVGIIVVGSTRGHSSTFANELAAYRAAPSQKPRMATLPDARHIPEVFVKLFAPQGGIK